MYKKHDSFIEPSNKNAIIWRYLDFTKYVSLLEKKALFFSRADLLGDPFEGSYPDFNAKLRSNLYPGIPQDSLKIMSESNKKLIQTMFVNCWHMSEFESAAMWKLHLQTGEGVAIRSTFKKLTEGLTDSKEIFIGEVKYINYEKFWMKEGNAFYPFLHKRESFEHERELRAMFMEFPVKDGKLDWSFEQPLGEYINVNPEVLIDSVHTFPTAPDWFHEIVVSVSKKFGLASSKISKSRLNRKPVY